MYSCCLRDRYCDFNLKVRSLFLRQFEYMAETGVCTVDLWHYLKLCRAHWGSNTQKVEGANGVLQGMANAARNMHMPLANARLSLKLGLPMTAAECAQEDAFLPQYMQETKDLNAGRYGQVAPTRLKAREHGFCEHELRRARALPLAAGFYKVADVSSRKKGWGTVRLQTRHRGS